MQPISKAIEHVGGASKLAGLLGVSVQAVCFWRDGKRSTPIDKIAEIERVTEAVVRRWDLRPDDWHRIWPELIGTPGAPEVQAEQGA